MNRLMAARPLLLRTMVQSVQSNKVAVGSIQQRAAYHSEDISPPASFNQLPQPEGDWTDNHNKKQTKYNAALAASAVIFIATIAFVNQSEILHFNSSLPETYE